MAKQFTYDETLFKPKQREVALALVEREFLPKAERPTKDEVAVLHGISPMTLYRWQKNDANFIAYMGHISNRFMESNFARVYAKLLESVDHGSIKAIELFLKRAGDLETKSELTIHQQQGELTAQERIDKINARKAAALAAQAAQASNGASAPDEDDEEEED